MLRIRALGRWAVGRLCIWPLDIRAPGCWTSVHLAAGQLDIFAFGRWTSVHLGVGHPCIWPLGSWTSLCLAVEHPCVWLLDILAPLAVGHPCTWLCTWPLGSWTSSCLAVGHPCTWMLCIRALGRWERDCKASGMVTLCIASGIGGRWGEQALVRYPCFAILGGDGGKKGRGVCLQECGDDLCPKLRFVRHAVKVIFYLYLYVMFIRNERNNECILLRVHAGTSH